MPTITKRFLFWHYTKHKHSFDEIKRHFFTVAKGHPRLSSNCVLYPGDTLTKIYYRCSECKVYETRMIPGWISKEDEHRER